MNDYMTFTVTTSTALNELRSLSAVGYYYISLQQKQNK